MESRAYQVNQPTVLNAPTVVDDRGSLTWLEGKLLPFAIQRIYMLSGSHAGINRGGHAHKELMQVLLAIGGPLEVEIFNPKGRRLSFRLSPFEGALYIPRAHWRTVKFVAHASVCLVLASAEYDENDYIRDFDEFKRWSGCE